MLRITVLCLLVASAVVADEYGAKKVLRRARIPRRYGPPLYGPASRYQPGIGFGPRPGYGYVRDIVLVDEAQRYPKAPPAKIDVIRDHDEAGYDLPKLPPKPLPPRVRPPIKTEVIRDHDEAGYDLPKRPIIREPKGGYDHPRRPIVEEPEHGYGHPREPIVREPEHGYDHPRRPIVKEPYPPTKKHYGEVPVALPAYDRPPIVAHREEIVKDTPYGVKHEVHEGKHIGDDVPDSVAHFEYDMTITPDCAYATNGSLCLEDQAYPVDVIKYAIKKDRSYLKRLLADVVYQSADNMVDGLTKSQEEGYSYEHYFGKHTKGTHHGAPYTDYTYNREYYKKGGYLCPASVAYVRPKRARNTRGQWKLIVNLPTDYTEYGHKYTQTVRLEKCIYPGAPCSYMGSEYHSKCLQKTNFERLLVYTYDLGLHIDVFRMPVACSCHMGGHGGKEYGKVKSY